MDLLPLFHNLQGRRCVMVGGGSTALRKLRQLLDSGATVELIAPEINAAIQQLSTKHSLNLHQRKFKNEDLDAAVLVIAATNNKQLNKQVSEQAQKLNIPVNVVDQPKLCTVIFPSVVDRSPIQIAISSGGTAPVLARILRTRLEALVPAGYGKLAKLAGKFRPRVKEKIPDSNSRKAFWEDVFSGEIAELVFSEKLGAAESRLQQNRWATYDFVRRGLPCGRWPWRS